MVWPFLRDSIAMVYILPLSVAAHAHVRLPRSSSASRRTASAAGFLSGRSGQNRSLTTMSRDRVVGERAQC
jgi:hypothetical protein